MLITKTKKKKKEKFKYYRNASRQGQPQSHVSEMILTTSLMYVLLDLKTTNIMFYRCICVLVYFCKIHFSK